jgi:hypothetical protein
VGEQISSSTWGVEDPPEIVREFLEGHAQAIEDTRELLLTAERPRWEQDLSSPIDAPLPNLLAHIELQEVLVADALWRYSEGDTEPAVDGLDAAWRLNSVLWERPMLISRMIARASTHLHLGLMRHLTPTSRAWSDELRGLGLRDRMLDAVAFDGWAMLRGVRQSMERDAGTMNLVMSEYVDVCMADFMLRHLEWVNEERARPGRCWTAQQQQGAEVPFQVPFWNHHGRIARSIAVLNMMMTIDRVDRAELDVELTRNWLTLEPGEEVPSEACAGLTWRMRELEDGRLELALSEQEPLWPDLGAERFRVPQRFVGRRDCRVEGTAGRIRRAEDREIRSTHC